jgi:hypothetical protein
MTNPKNLGFVKWALLVASIFGLTVSVVSAAETVCGYTKNRQTAFCYSTAKDDNDVWRCDKHADGTWSCYKLATKVDTPPDLKDALTKARAATSKAN